MSQSQESQSGGPRDGRWLASGGAHDDEVTERYLNEERQKAEDAERAIEAEREEEERHLLEEEARIHGIQPVEEND